MADYAYYLFVRDWPELTTAIYGLEQRLRAQRRFVAADSLLRAYGTLRDELLELAIRASAFGTRELRRREHDTRVRPDTQGQGGPRLGDSLVSEPVGPQNILPGSVGVANEDVLDQNVPWWLTNEKGSSALVGRRIYGYFYGEDDAAAPAAEDFRVHPLFQPGYSPVSGGGVIRNPIPARWFIAKSVPEIERYWQTGFRAAKAKFDAELTRVIDMAAA